MPPVSTQLRKLIECFPIPVGNSFVVLTVLKAISFLLVVATHRSVVKVVERKNRFDLSSVTEFLQKKSHFFGAFLKKKLTGGFQNSCHRSRVQHVATGEKLRENEREREI